MKGHFPKTDSESFLKMVIIDHLKQDVLSLLVLAVFEEETGPS